jgi:hypothetical protein
VTGLRGEDAELISMPGQKPPVQAGRWRTILCGTIIILCVASFFGTGLFLHHCGYQLRNTFPFEILITQTEVIFVLFVIAAAVRTAVLKSKAASGKTTMTITVLLLGLACFHSLCEWRDEKSFMEGARERLVHDVDLAQLQHWAIGVTPDAPQTEGETIHLPNGETIVPAGPQGDGASWGGGGSFRLLPAHLPESLAKLMQTPLGIVVHGKPDPTESHVEIGYFGRWGLRILVGSTNYVYEPGLPALKCTNGIYVLVGGGG